MTPSRHTGPPSTSPRRKADYLYTCKDKQSTVLLSRLPALRSDLLAVSCFETVTRWPAQPRQREVVALEAWIRSSRADSQFFAVPESSSKATPDTTQDHSPDILLYPYDSQFSRGSEEYISEVGVNQ